MFYIFIVDIFALSICKNAAVDKLSTVKETLVNEEYKSIRTTFFTSRDKTLFSI